MTASKVVRAAGVAVRWFQRNFKTVGVDELERALDHLEADDDERRWMSKTLVELCTELGLETPRNVGSPAR